MTIRRFFLLFVLALVAEIGVFAVSYRDLLYLRHPADRLFAEPAERFAAHAEGAMTREELTRQHLETIAATARGFEMTPLEVRALERLFQAHPDDVELQLRLADAMRRVGQYQRAEELYLDVLELREGPR